MSQLAGKKIKVTPRVRSALALWNSVPQSACGSLVNRILMIGTLVPKARLLTNFMLAAMGL